MSTCVAQIQIYDEEQPKQHSYSARINMNICLQFPPPSFSSLHGFILHCRREMHCPNKLYTGYACIQHVFMLYSYYTRDIFMGISVRSDFTILNKYCFVTHASVTLIPKVKTSAGNTEITASSLGD